LRGTAKGGKKQTKQNKNNQKEGENRNGDIVIFIFLQALFFFFWGISQYVSSRSNCEMLPLLSDIAKPRNDNSKKICLGSNNVVFRELYCAIETHGRWWK